MNNENVSYTAIIKKRFGYEPGDPEFANLIPKLIENPDYGLKKKKPVVPPKQKIEPKKIDPIQKAIDEEKKRQEKYTSGFKNWFK